MKFGYQKFILGRHDSRKPLVARPLIPVFLVNGARRTRTSYYALLDSGADRIIFPADLAEEVGIGNVESGTLEQTVGIANQRTNVYFHRLAVQVAGDRRELSVDVGFSREVGLPLLGRSFFEHFKSVTFAQPKGEIELRV
jgi:hypothetical protein